MSPSHGSEDMPIWGRLFSSISQGHEGQVQQRITNLVTYLEGVQAKSKIRTLIRPRTSVRQDPFRTGVRGRRFSRRISVERMPV
jgi:hypothetical protein